MLQYEEKKLQLRQYQDRLKKMGVDNNTKILYIIENKTGLTRSYYCWIDQNSFNLFSHISDVDENNIEFFSQDDFVKMRKDQVLSVPLPSIEYYQIIGGIRHQMNISGGGGGGSSIIGAIAGSIVAGSVGAIIGSRKKVNQIKSETIEVDDRKIEFVYNDHNNNQCIIICHYKCLQIFESLIPEKEYSIVQEKKRKKLVGEENITKNKNENQDIPGQIDKLFQLMEKGVLTEDEFIEKKKELLSKM